MAKRKLVGAQEGENKKKRKKQSPKIKKTQNMAEKIQSQSSDNAERPKAKWTNKTRVLVLSSRGISHRSRHLMEDLKRLMPHSKSENKMDRKDKLFVLNEMCEMKNCNKCIYFEGKKKQDLYMWISNVPRGPSAKFLVENVHTMLELKMTGNSLKGSRPILSFDKAFDRAAHHTLLKELFIQIFGTPAYHPKSQPFFDRVMSFSIADGRIYIRNYQIVEDSATLAEMGPRYVLNPIRIFEGSFGGPTLYQNPQYVSPNEHRRAIARKIGQKYKGKLDQKMARELRPDLPSYPSDPLDDVFTTAQSEEAS